MHNDGSDCGEIQGICRSRGAQEAANKWEEPERGRAGQEEGGEQQEEVGSWMGAVLGDGEVPAVPWEGDRRKAGRSVRLGVVQLANREVKWQRVRMVAEV